MPAPQRFASIVLPELALDRVSRRERRLRAAGWGGGGRAAEDAVHLVVETIASRQLVVQACASGRAAGIRRGMAVAQARALVPAQAVRIHEHRPDLDRRLLQAVARWMLRITPRVAVDEPDGLLLDLTGCDRLHGDESALLRRVRGELGRMGFRARLAGAATAGAAWAVARYGPADDACVASGHETVALDPLPVAALRVGPQAIDELAQIGIETIGQIRRVPRSELAGRGGGWREGGLLARLDQAFGRRPERIEPIAPPVRPAAERVFAGPVLQPEAIVLAARELLEQLVERLEALECGVTRLQLRCVCPDVPPQVFDLRLGRPSRSRRHLWALLAPRLERVHLDFGVESMHLEALRIGRIEARQAASRLLAGAGEGGRSGRVDLAGADHADPAAEEPDAASRRRCEAALGELLDALVDRLGPDRVLAMRAVDAHVPEHAGEPVPLGEPDSPQLRVAGRSGSGRRPSRPPRPGPPALERLAVVTSGAASRGDGEDDPHAPRLGSSGRRRPPHLLPAPEPMAAQGHRYDGTPRRFRWRDGEHLVVQAIGPERIAAPWWEARRLAGGGRGADLETARLVRDYYRVQDAEGRWLWIFRRTELSAPTAGDDERFGMRGGAAACTPVPGRWFVHGIWD